MIDNDNSDRVYGRRGTDVRHFAPENGRAFMVRQLTPLMRALVMTGAIGYAMFVAGTEWLGDDAIPLLPKAVILVLLVINGLASLPDAARRYMTVAGLVCIALLQVGIVLNGIYRPDPIGWLLPGFLVVPLAASPTWLNTRDYLFSLALSLSGPLLAWYIVRPPPPVLMQCGLFLTIAIGAATVIHVFTQWQLKAQLALQGRLSEIAYTDTLTGIANRMHFFSLGERQVRLARQEDEPLCALYIDVDHFKAINDRYGHAAGDDALITVARTLESCMREGDTLGRVGGEEFAMLLPATGLPGAARVAERIRQRIEALDLSCGALSISVGVAMLRRDDNAINGLLAAADHALRRAKSKGRNRVEVADARAPGAATLHVVRDDGAS